MLCHLLIFYLYLYLQNQLVSVLFRLKHGRPSRTCLTNSDSLLAGFILRFARSMHSSPVRTVFTIYLSLKLNFTNFELCISHIKSSLTSEIEVKTVSVMSNDPHLTINVSVNLNFNSFGVVKIELNTWNKIFIFGPLALNLGFLGRQQGDENTG